MPHNMALLQKTFPGRVISHRSEINWPPRPCNLTPLDFLCGITRKTVLCRLTFNAWALKNQHSSSYGWDIRTAQYVSKSDWKLSQNDQCLQHSAWRLFKWCQRFKLYNKKKGNIMENIFCLCLIYVYFWNHGMDNPIYLHVVHKRYICVCNCIYSYMVSFQIKIHWLVYPII